MGDKCNCYRFSPRDSLSGAVAQIADYLSKHPGWNETELRAFVDGLISSAGVETFNGRSGNVTLNKDDVNNLMIANCYFAEADETIESIDVLALYKLGIRIVFTQYSSEVDGYTLAYGIEYYPGTDTAKAYLFSSGSGGVGAIVSVNGKTGVVVLKASDILMNNGDTVEMAVSSAQSVADSAATDATNALNKANAAYSADNAPPYPVTSVNGKTGSVTGLYDSDNQPPYPVTSVNGSTGAVKINSIVSYDNTTLIEPQSADGFIRNCASWTTIDGKRYRWIFYAVPTDMGTFHSSLFDEEANVWKDATVYTSFNPPPYPVTSVNGLTGEVNIKTLNNSIKYSVDALIPAGLSLIYDIPIMTSGSLPKGNTLHRRLTTNTSGYKVLPISCITVVQGYIQCSCCIVENGVGMTFTSEGVEGGSSPFNANLYVYCETPFTITGLEV